MPNDKQNKEPNKANEEAQALHDKVVAALDEIGADVSVFSQIVSDEQGYLKLVAVPKVVKKQEQVEEPQNDASGDSPDKPGQSPKKA